ncbi:30S ribosomal protein S4 [Candidatus Carsonella ruddii]|uniref:Small ribosomal subunit protein uS4 n=1 Tax=Candidatus Carsonella ruddii CE isolate Thao2000 TaxID=1202536 RepID=J7GSZ6_CARRU|nr:30S ribosomal protein S4 [Candidatus Carsonella ruddii]AFP83619.1 ribosomal protein S4 [Candidatus Carsonella ruddii CE isolate Thao2000]
MSKKKANNSKFCKREGENLEYFAEKKIKVKSLLTPGEHGIEKGKYSDFGLLLRTKQKIKRYYCIYEKQFKIIYKKMSKKIFSYENFINILERRLDNLVYRMNFSISRKEARQYIVHGLVFVNFKKINFPSYILSPGDSIFVKNKFLLKKFNYDFKNFFDLNWIYLNYFKGFGILLSLPNKNKFYFDKNLILDIY